MDSWVVQLCSSRQLPHTCKVEKGIAEHLSFYNSSDDKFVSG